MNLFLSQGYLYKKSVIDSNVDFAFLEPIIEMSQLEDLMPMLGSDFHDYLEERSTPSASPGLSVEEKLLIDKYILPCAVPYFMARATPLFKFKYTNKGLMEKNSDNSSPVSSSDLRMTADDWKNLAESMKSRFVRFVKQHADDYPTYFTTTSTTLITPDQEAFETTIFLPDGKESNTPRNWGDTRDHD